MLNGGLDTKSFRPGSRGFARPGRDTDGPDGLQQSLESPGNLRCDSEIVRHNKGLVSGVVRVSSSLRCQALG